MVDANEIKGAAREFGGKAQDAIGDLAGNAKCQAEGKLDEVAGKVQKTFGAAVDEIIDNVKEQPLTALAIVAGAMFLAGWLTRK